MCSKQDYNHIERCFVVNGCDCLVALDSTGISWHKSGANKRHESGKRVDFSHIIGVRRQTTTTTSTDKQFTRLKIYYARSNENNSHGRYLKLRKLIISRGKAGPAVVQTKPPVDDAGSENNSAAIGLAGSTSHLSSLSSTSSTLTSTATRSLNEASSPQTSPGTIWPQDEHKRFCDKLMTTNTGNYDKATLFQQQNISSSSLSELANCIELALKSKREQRPKSLLIFVNPFGGKGRALHLYKSRVKRLLDLAQIDTTLIVTDHANHARETIQDLSFDVSQFDGIVCVGGDGMFSELMNGLLFRYNQEIICNEQQKQSDDSQNEEDHRDEMEMQMAKLMNNNGNNNNNSNDSDNRIANLISDSNNDDNIIGRDMVLDAVSASAKLRKLRGSYGGIGRPFVSPPIPLGVIGAGSTDANSFGLIGTNDVITATLNIVIGNQIKIDACSIHTIQDDRLLRFVSTFVAYGYFGDVVRESEKLRWLGPSRYDVTGLNNLLKNRSYKGLVSILVSDQDGSPLDLERCHQECEVCFASPSEKSLGKILKPQQSGHQTMTFIEKQGSFVGVNAAVMACRCPKTRKGFSPNNHLANGCADLILVRPCSRMQYIRYLVRTGWTKKSPFDLNYVEAYRCRQFEFLTPPPATPTPSNPSEGRQIASDGSSCSASTSSASSDRDGSSKGNSLDSKVDHPVHNSSDYSSWNADGEILDEQSIRVKVNNQLLRVFGTGEP